MASDYTAITSENITNLGADLQSRRNDLNNYSDYTHFIFEILQNADDHNATEILFDLDDERIIITHNGTEFSEKNVRSISYFCGSTSMLNVENTGRFGIGFKSVFRISPVAQVHSGRENFEIYDLYKLRPYPAPHDWAPAETVFVFPFYDGITEQNKPLYLDEPPPAKAHIVESIWKRLRKLESTTLLFTKKLKRISCVYKGEKRNYTRSDEYDNGLDLVKISEDPAVRNYVVFRTPVPGQPEQSRPVEIAFCIDSGTVVKIPDARLHVLFATTRHTYTGFIINGPFHTTSNRENIREGEGNSANFNCELISLAAELICDSLGVLAAKGYMSIGLLNCLPIEPDKFDDDALSPIYEKIKEGLKTQPLLPVHGRPRDFVAGENAYLVRGAEDLLRLLTHEDLGGLYYNEQARWLPEGITETVFPQLHAYLKSELGVKEVNYTAFIREVRDNENFLPSKDDAWMSEFYRFLHNHRNLYETAEGLARSTNIIRLEDGLTHVKPFQDGGEEPSAWLPVAGFDSDLPMVRSAICASPAARSFLLDLGYRSIDPVETLIARVLPEYEAGHIITEERHTANISLTLRLLNDAGIQEARKEALRERLKQTHFIRCSINTNICYKLPSESYQRTMEMEAFFPGAPFMCPGQDNFIVLGVNKIPRIIDFGDYTVEQRNAYEAEHRRHPKASFNPFIEGLREFIIGFRELSTDKQAKSAKALWGFLCKHADKRENCVCNVGGKKNIQSSWIFLLRQMTWIPVDGSLRKPSEVTAKNLPEGFERNPNLEGLLGIKDADEYAKALGLRLENIPVFKRIQSAVDLNPSLLPLLENTEAFTRALGGLHIEPAQAAGENINPIDLVNLGIGPMAKFSGEMFYGGFNSLINYDILRSPYSERNKTAWRALFLRGALETIGAYGGGIGTNRKFMQICFDEGFLASDSSADSFSAIRSYVDDHLDSFGMGQQLRETIILLVMNNWLSEYIDALLCINDRKDSALSVAQIFNPRTDPGQSRGGADAPPLSQILGVGAHFVLRELVRVGIINNQLVYPLCYVPTADVLRKIVSLGGPDLNSGTLTREQQSRAIYDYMERLSPGDPTFRKRFDIPIRLYGEQP